MFNELHRVSSETVSMIMQTFTMARGMLKCLGSILTYPESISLFLMRQIRPVITSLNIVGNIFHTHVEQQTCFLGKCQS
jgi:hypothetical protein